ncbi:bifunctional ornithine acetyltransferase/N-acetylglutamate synthase [Evansella cellulosilytica]|uniref:Arginine biosynthesis bifunctional protein ArgJ n=1 Tax=Evansella cellulosilytica (strain ATCC 21833 / DSM 2522 / FERM P-1141 / JCM 9156 / N-4) TaxID=649639 RepID=E6TYY8_EVAC2|nr:bifunctional ornithine acetyltransferase/N-acetylglutamate synthase [Evansella cellulosilytica]ADU32431.1 arginine biosynthesis bifunctional protein ArgJ [Evansella cellulosilytica DSM 2522]
MQTTIKKKLHVLTNGNVTTPEGYKAGGLHCGIKKYKLDLGWIQSDVPANTAGVYTTNQFQAAPLHVTKESIAVENKIQAILVNSGVANACTGDKGLEDAYEMRHLFASKLGIEDHLVAVTSTGLIGTHLPMEKIKAGVSESDKSEHIDTDRFEKAILTTDTCVKHIAVQFEIDGKKVSIGGAAKGSGMIHPNMATMLAFVTTDANVEQESLSNALKQVTNKTYNMITVDGDSSTNDMVLVMANGKANNAPLNENHPEWEKFLDALEQVSQILAKKIARDGEGATKLVEVEVKGAQSEEAARKISKTIISSNLVKTAIYGADPNWGRIVCAIGYSEQPILPEKVSVALGPIPVVENGLPLYFDEEVAKDYLQQETVSIVVDLQQGEASATAWGCDLTYDYVKINASYRT